MRKIAGVIALLFIFCAPVSALGEKPLLFIGQDFDTIQSYVHDLNHIPDGFMVYTSIQKLEGLISPVDSGAGVQNAQALIDQYPGIQMQIGLYMVGASEQAVQEQYDENIVQLSEWFKKNSAMKFYLRIGYEFDNPQNNYQPEAYINAYRYIVDKLRAEQVLNVDFVWHSYAAFVEGKRERWYPGDQYVDWVGLSFFDAYNKSNMEDVVKIARKHGKPLMIAEATPRGRGVSQGGRSWHLWYKKLFDFSDKHNVKAICYINADWEQSSMFQGQGWGNARIQDNPIVKTKWLMKVGK